MHIVIKDTQTAKTSIDFHAFYLDSLLKKTKRSLFAWPIIGLLFITFDIVTFNDKSWTFGSNEPISLHLGLGIGLTCFYLVYLTMFQWYKGKSKYLRILQLNLPRLHGTTNTSTTIIDNNGIKFECDSLKVDCKWNLITAFTIANDYLVIYKQDSNVAPFYFRANSLTTDEYNELLTFLRQSKKEIPAKRFPLYD